MRSWRKFNLFICLYAQDVFQHTTDELNMNFIEFLSRPCLRRQSARFNPEEPAKDSYENCSSTSASQCKETVREIVPTSSIEKQEPVATKDLYENCSSTSASQCKEIVPETVPTSSIERQADDNSTDRSQVQESRRSSVARPLRRAAEKVQSYKEIPLNIKMRRHV